MLSAIIGLLLFDRQDEYGGDKERRDGKEQNASHWILHVFIVWSLGLTVKPIRSVAKDTSSRTYTCMQHL